MDVSSFQSCHKIISPITTMNKHFCFEKKFNSYSLFELRILQVRHW